MRDKKRLAFGVAAEGVAGMWEAKLNSVFRGSVWQTLCRQHIASHTKPLPESQSFCFT